MNTATLRRESFPASTATTLRVTVDHADVLVRHEPTSTATIEVSCHDEVDLTPVDITASGDDVVVHVPSLFADESGRRGVAIDLGFFSFSLGDARARGLRVEAVVPEGCALEIGSKSGDVVVTGASGAVIVRTGSGDVRVESAARVEAHVGSGDVTLGEAGTAVVASGSGDVVIDRARQEAQLRSGSGDVRIRSASGTLTTTSGSGDLHVALFDGETITARTASGDVSVGLPAGVPVWQDVQTVTGDVIARLGSVGEPAEGERFITVRATTTSGDVTLHNA